MSKRELQAPDASRPNILGATIIGVLLVLVIILAILHTLLPGVSL